MSYQIKTIGLLTSGGDAPGMNAAIRAITRAAIYHNIRVKAIYRGYKGLIAGEIREFTTQDVSNIIQRGGTIIKSARSDEFMTKEGRAKAWQSLQREEIDALIVIGGNGSFAGALALTEEYDIPVIGLPGTVDNDLWGTDFTIGYDTALNTVMECVDKIKDTASSHERVFFVEVMGRDAGFLALNSAIAAGAEAAIIPERRTQEEQLEAYIGNGFRKSKNSSIVIVSEHSEKGGAQALADKLKAQHPEYDIRVSILGHLQRGGSPTANDRILASRLGVAAIQSLLEGQRTIMVGVKDDEVVYVPLTKTINEHKDVKQDKVQALHILSI
ncbi:MAG: 6-phosphofructokinase [Paludibacteraceae bacterium]|nr:6-phosphofructokinase [Paludibacteraceae bacterium]